MDMYKDYYSQFSSIESKAKLAAEQVSSHPVASNIGSEIKNVIDGIKSIASNGSLDQEDETVSGFVASLNELSSGLSNLEAFVNSYSSAEQIYVELDSSLQQLKEADENLKSTCGHKPRKDSDKYQSGEQDISFDSKAYNRDFTRWKSNVEGIKKECESLVERINEYIEYLEQVNNCNPTEGAISISVPSGESIAPAPKFNYNIDGITREDFDVGNLDLDIDHIQSAVKITDADGTTTLEITSDDDYLVLFKGLAPEDYYMGELFLAANCNNIVFKLNNVGGTGDYEQTVSVTGTEQDYHIEVTDNEMSHNGSADYNVNVKWNGGDKYNYTKEVFRTRYKFVETCEGSGKYDYTLKMTFNDNERDPNSFVETCKGSGEYDYKLKKIFACDETDSLSFVETCNGNGKYDYTLKKIFGRNEMDPWSFVKTAKLSDDGKEVIYEQNYQDNSLYQDTYLRQSIW